MPRPRLNQQIDDQGLTELQREILRLIIQQYVLTANPVGSRYISRISSLGLSDATLRNVMADLELLGYIDHPHTSAGRMPTDKGYNGRVARFQRSFVGLLMTVTDKCAEVFIGVTFVTW